VEGWLLFVLIIGALPMLVLPTLLTTLAANDPDVSDLASLGLTSANLKVLFAWLSVVLVMSGAVYGLLTAVMAWSRGLAADVATILDAPLSRPPAPLNDWTAAPASQDPWKGPVMVIPPRS
jgi:hypothetical protein